MNRVLAPDQPGLSPLLEGHNVRRAALVARETQEAVAQPGVRGYDLSKAPKVHWLRSGSAAPYGEKQSVASVELACRYRSDHSME